MRINTLCDVLVIFWSNNLTNNVKKITDARFYLVQMLRKISHVSCDYILDGKDNWQAKISI